MRRGLRRNQPASITALVAAIIRFAVIPLFSGGARLDRIIAADTDEIGTEEAAASPGSIAGRVTDLKAGSPVAGVGVSLDPAPPALALAITGDDGVYRLAGLPAGSYSVRFLVQGTVERRVENVVVMRGTETRIDVALPRRLPEDAFRVTVVADARALEHAGPSETRVSRGALRSRPASLEDPFRALAGSAGIVTQDDFKADLRVRGGEAAETGVLVDGLPLPQPYHFSGGAGSASAIGSDLVDEVQVSTGGFSVEFGDALAGIIDLLTRDDRPDRFTARAGVSTIGTHAAVAGPAGEGRWGLAGRRSGLGSYQDRVGESGIETVAFHDLMGSLSVPLAAGGRLDLSALLTGDAFDQAVGDGGHATLSNGQRAARARYETMLDERTFLRLLVSEGDLEERGQVDGGTSSAERVERQDLKISLQRIAGRAHRLNGGLDLGRERGTIEGTVSRGDTLLWSAVRGESRTSGVFFEDLWRPSDWLALRLGVRADRFSLTGQSSLSPRAAFDIRAFGNLSVRGAVGRFVQFPRHEQRFLAAGEPLGRQVADHFILGVERTCFGGARLTIEAYRKNTRDTAGEALNRYVDLPERMTSFDRGRVSGFDLTLEDAAGPWRTRLDYSYALARQEKDGVVSARNGDQRHQASGLIGRAMGGGWDLSATLRYRTGLPYTPLMPWTNGIDSGLALGALNAARLPDYARMDIRVARTISRAWGRMEISVDLINVTNRRNVRAVEADYDPATGIFREVRHGQAPFVPVFGMGASF